jgi:hypothetical protein
LSLIVFAWFVAKPRGSKSVVAGLSFGGTSLVCFNLTRRALMQRSAIPPSISARWSLSRELLQSSPEGDETETERVSNLESGVLRDPIRTFDDAVAKLSAIELAFIDGERTDGADATALRETIAWLKTNRPRAR